MKLNIDIPSFDYCENLIRNTGIMMIPSEMFDYGNSHVRIGFGRKNFGEILDVWNTHI